MCVNNGRRVVLGVDTSERIADNRTAKIAVYITVMNALVYGFVKAAANEVNVLTDFKKNNRHSGVLTDRNIKLLCRIKIGFDIAENAFGKSVLFTFAAIDYCFGKIIGQKLVRLDAKLRDCLAYFIYINFSQIYHLNVSIFRL